MNLNELDKKVRQLWKKDKRLNCKLCDLQTQIDASGGGSVSEGSELVGSLANSILFTNAAKEITTSSKLTFASDKLLVIGNAIDSSVVEFKNPGGYSINISSHAGYATIKGETGTTFTLFNDASYSVYVNSGLIGRYTNTGFGLGTSTVDAKLHVKGTTPTTVVAKMEVASSQSADVININTSGGTGGDMLKMTAGGVVTLSRTGSGNLFNLVRTDDIFTFIKADILSGSASLNFGNSAGTVKKITGYSTHFQIENNLMFSDTYAVPNAKIGIVGETQTGSSAKGILDMTQTWNTTGTPTALKLNITETGAGSSAGSSLVDLQFGGSTRFKVVKDGTVTLGNSTNSLIINAGSNAMFARTGTIYFSNNADAYFGTLKDSGLQLGNGAAVANSKSIVDLTSTTKGVLIPRMTTTQKNAISSPPEGLEVYDLTLHQKSYYNGSTWVNY